MAGNRVQITATMNDKVSGPLAKMRDKFDTLGKTKGFQSVVMGVGVGVGVAALNALGGAMNRVVGILGDSITAALEEEKSIAGLNAAIKANVAGWDGNNDAMEKVLASRMRLGHSDDEQRESLKLLVGATHDVNKALDVQRTAMDLAAFKGISLAAASEALVKVEAGQFRILKTLGIQLPKNATATEALAAVQKVAAGSAEALAKTTGGKMLSSQIRIGEVMEKLGEKALPLVVAGIEGVAGVAETAATAITDFAEDTRREIDNLVEVFVNLSDFLDSTGIATRNAGEEAAVAAWKFDRLARNVDANVDPAIDLQTQIRNLGATASTAASPLDDLGDEALDTAEDFDDLKASVEKSADAMLESVFGPVELKGKLAELEGQYRDTKAELKKLEAIKNPTLAQREDIIETRGELAETKAEIIRTKIQLGLLDKASLQGAINEVVRLKGSTAAARQEIHNTYLELVRLNGGDFTTKNTGGGGMGKRHSGGPVAKGVPVIVGKPGAEELFVPNASGSIVPGQMASGGRGMTVVNFNSTFPPTPAQAREIARVLQDVTDFDRTLATFAPGA